MALVQAGNPAEVEQLAQCISRLLHVGLDPALYDVYNLIYTMITRQVTAGGVLSAIDGIYCVLQRMYAEFIEERRSSDLAELSGRALVVSVLSLWHLHVTHRSEISRKLFVNADAQVKHPMFVNISSMVATASVYRDEGSKKSSRVNSSEDAMNRVFVQDMLQYPAVEAELVKWLAGCCTAPDRQNADLMKNVLNMLANFPRTKAQIESKVAEIVKDHYEAVASTFVPTTLEWIETAAEIIRYIACLIPGELRLFDITMNLAKTAVFTARQELFVSQVRTILLDCCRTDRMPSIELQHVNRLLTVTSTPLACMKDAFYALFPVLVPTVKDAQQQRASFSETINILTWTLCLIYQCFEASRELVSIVITRAAEQFVTIGSDPSAQMLAGYFVSRLTSDSIDWNVANAPLTYRPKWSSGKLPLLSTSVSPLIQALESRDTFHLALWTRLSMLFLSEWTASRTDMSAVRDDVSSLLTLVANTLGTAVVKEMQTMATDLQLSADFAARMMDTAANSVDLTRLRVLVANQFCWKLSTSLCVRAPPLSEYTALVAAFETAYKAVHSGRKLQWLHDASTAECSVQTPDKKGRRTMILSLCQLYVVTKLEEASATDEMDDSGAAKRQRVSGVTTDSLVQALGSEYESKIANVLTLMVETGLVTRSAQGEYLLNSRFMPTKETRNLATLGRRSGSKPAAADKEQDAVIKRERIFALHAAIVRCMKSTRKVDSVDALFAKVASSGSLLFPFDKSLFRQQVETLISKEYMKRGDNNCLEYIA
jgi:hypothetical protein